MLQTVGFFRWVQDTDDPNLKQALGSVFHFLLVMPRNVQTHEAAGDTRLGDTVMDNGAEGKTKWELFPIRECTQ